MDGLVDALDKATPGSPEAIALRKVARRAQAGRISALLASFDKIDPRLLRSCLLLGIFCPQRSLIGGKVVHGCDR
jgi:hypothetical protein